MIDRATFFAAIRPAPFGKKLTQSQVDGINAVLDEWEARRLTDLRWLAYMLVTDFHETARTMAPIYERGARAYFNKYEPGTKIGKDLGNTTKGDGYLFRGRGLVQLTGRSNYRKLSVVTGVDLIAHPDEALKLPIAVKAMFQGMIDGLFTTKCLADYFTIAKTDWINARRIINGTDKAALIAGYAKAFYAALVAAFVAPAPVIIRDPGPVIDMTDPPFLPPLEPTIQETDMPIGDGRIIAVASKLGTIIAGQLNRQDVPIANKDVPAATGKVVTAIEQSKEVAVVPVKSGWFSKLQWLNGTGGVGIVSILAGYFLGVPITPEQVVALIGAIGTISTFGSMIIKQFFTGTVTPQSVGK